MSIGAISETQRRERYLRSLLEEREKMQRAGREDRVKAINAELGEAAQEAEAPPARAQKRPAYEGRRTSR